MSLGSNTYGTVCGLTSAVSLQCSVRVDDVTQTEVHENLQCSGKVTMFFIYFTINYSHVCFNDSLVNIYC